MVLVAGHSCTPLTASASASFISTSATSSLVNPRNSSAEVRRQPFASNLFRFDAFIFFPIPFLGLRHQLIVLCQTRHNEYRAGCGWTFPRAMFGLLLVVRERRSIGPTHHDSNVLNDCKNHCAGKTIDSVALAPAWARHRHAGLRPCGLGYS